MKKIFANDEVEFYTQNSNNSLDNEIINHTLKKLEIYRKIFKKEKLLSVKNKIFYSLDDYRNDYKKIREIDAPDYSRGWVSEEGVATICITPNMLSNKEKIKSSFAHEIFHYYYMNYYYKDNRIVWFDEGMAQFLSGEYENLTEDKWCEIYQKWLGEYIPINNLNERINGNSNIPDDLIFKRKNVFNGYVTSLLCIKFLYENEGENYLFEIMFDNDKILELGKTIIDEMKEYFKMKYMLKKSKQLKKYSYKKKLEILQQ